MSVLQIVCQNCGAKYKLPESFQADKAKCKECGTAIDVAAQRNAGAPAAAAAASAAAVTPAKMTSAKAVPAQAKARPAEARPAEARARKTESAASTRPSRSDRHGANDDAGAEKPGRRHGRHGDGDKKSEKKKGPSAALLGGGLVLVAAIVVGLIFLLKGDSETRTDTANATGNSQPGANAHTRKPEDKPADTPTAPADPKTPDAGKPDAAKPDAKPADASASTKPTDANPADSKPAPKAGDPKTGPRITSPDQVFDPKSLEELAYPEEISQEVRDEVNSLVGDIEGGGTRAERTAKTRLEELGYPSLFGLANRLRTLDYKVHSDTMLAFEVSKLMESISKGTNAGFKVPGAEELSLDDMDYNAKTVKTWQNFLRQLSSKEKYDTYLKQKEAALQKQGKKN